MIAFVPAGEYLVTYYLTRGGCVELPQDCIVISIERFKPVDGAAYDTLTVLVRQD